MSVNNVEKSQVANYDATGNRNAERKEGHKKESIHYIKGNIK